MTRAECADVRDVVAELALGTLTGRERGAALAHIDGCDRCRRHLESLAHAADMLLLIAPEAEPPTNFNRRVLTRIQREHHRRPRRPKIAIAVAAAALALVLGAGGATVISVANPRPTPHVASDAQNVHVARFDASPGEHTAGLVFSPLRDPGWLFMVVHDTSDDETYTCQLGLANGRRLTIGRFGLRNGVGVWGRTVDLDTQPVRSVYLIDRDGTVAAVATIS